MTPVIIMNTRDYKKVIAKLETALKKPDESEKNIREALDILKKRN